MLLESGANTEATEVSGWTPLHIAAGWGCVDIVKILLEKGANKQHLDKSGSTPLDSAIIRRQAEVIDLLQ